jgi:hypothetical protein
VYGTYGISVFAVLGLSLDELAQQVPIVRLAQLTVLGDHRTMTNPYHYG